MINLDQLFFKKYDAANYNCAHLVNEAWKLITGVDIEEDLRGFMLPAGKREVKMESLRKFKRLKHKQSPCIVLFKSKGQEHHAGVFFKGKVLHIRKVGVSYQPLRVAQGCYTRVSFFTHWGDHA